MIESLEIKNFKSHRKSVMAFSSGVNAIIGSPNHGKTNVIRALLWLFNNRPLSGDILFNRLENGVVEVIGKLSDVPELISLKKEIITSKDGKSKEVLDACYSIGEREFRGMNKSVPDVIRQAFNVTELHVQEQFDQPYLVNSTGGEVAKTINRITRQEFADQLEGNLTKKVYLINKEIKALKEGAELLELELGQYDGLDAVEAVLMEAEKCGTEIEKLKAERDNLSRIISDAKVLNGRVGYLEKFIVVGEIISDIDRLRTEYDEDINFQSLLFEFMEFSRDSVRLAKITDELACVLEKIDLEVINFNGKIDAEEMLENFIKVSSDYKEIVKAYSKVKDEYVNELKSAKQCPLCFSSINSKVIERIKESL